MGVEYKIGSEEIERIARTLSENGKDKFYVYMLCDSKDHKPFYIGKGESRRIWEHEEGAEKERSKINDRLNKLLKDPEDSKRKLMEEEELEIELNNISKKHEKINMIKKEGRRIEKVIVKWGLTEHEAFMAESALINMYKYINGDNSLTNIQNGHASNKEKNNVALITKARSVETFLDECAIESIDINKVKDCDKAHIMMVDIANTFLKRKEMPEYKNKSDDDVIYDCARSAWIIGDKKRKLVQYVFALIHCKVVAIYKVSNESWKKRKDVILSNGDLPNTPYDYEKKIIEIIKGISKKEEIRNERGEMVNIDAWGERYCFYKLDTANDKTYDKLKKDFMGKLLTFCGVPKEQNDKFNFTDDDKFTDYEKKAADKIEKKENKSDSAKSM